MKKIWIAIVKLWGWRMVCPTVEERPELLHCVFVEAPHTSVYDFVVGIAYMWTLGVPGHIFIKKEFFRWPLGGLLRRYGCVPIDRGNPKGGIVQMAVQGLKGSDRYSVILTPEATRRPVRRWKRGFWEIATQAGVPIVPVCIDFGKREARLFDTLWPTDNWEKDQRRLHQLYNKRMARHPEGFVEADAPNIEKQ